MADATTTIGGAGHGLTLHGRVPRADAIRQYREWAQKQADHANELLANLEAMPDEDLRVSWWRGSAKLSEPKEAPRG